MSRSIAYVLVAATAAGLGLMLGQKHFTADAPTMPTTVAKPSLQIVTLIEPARALAPFNLVAADGSPFAADNLRGHWTVVFLGFSHCPDVCPTTLADLARAQKIWASMPESSRPRVLFVSIDPERDTPRKVGEYAAFFSPDTLAATGNEPALAEFAKSLGLVYMKVPGNGEDYTMDHSATLILVDPQGRRAGLIRPPLKAEAIAADLRLLAETRP